MKYQESIKNWVLVRVIYLFVFLSSCSISISASSLQFVQTEAGGLINKIDISKIEEIDSLTISGDLNGTDILVIRKMSNLRYLNMTNANIVNGGQSYYDDYITSENEIGDYFFSDKTNFISICLPASITKIRTSAFEGCSNLESIMLGNKLKEIGEKAFYNCSNLKGLIVPASVDILYKYAFGNCTSLESVIIEDSSNSLAFYFDTELSGKYYDYDWERTLYWKYCAFEGCNIDSLYIGRNFWYEPRYKPSRNYKSQFIQYPFYRTDVKCVCFGDYVTNIDDYAFANSKSLKHVYFGKGIKSVGREAFNVCGIELVSIPSIEQACSIYYYNESYHYRPTSNPLYYGHHLYINGKLVKQLIIPDNITTISDYAFAGLSDIDSIHIGNGVQYLGSFYGCKNVPERLVIPKTVLKTSTHFECEFKELYFEDSTVPIEGGYGIYPQIEKMYLGRNFFGGAYFRTDSLNSVEIGPKCDTIPNFLGCKNLITVTIPNHVKEIGGFEDCVNLSLVTLSNRQKKTGSFKGCKNLISLDVPNSVEEVNHEAFYDCSELSHVLIGANVKSVGIRAFGKCSNLLEVYSLNLTPPELYSDSFDETTYQNATLYVPKGCKTLYWLHPYWENFKKIEEIEIHEDITEKKAEAIAKYNEGLSLYNSFVELNSKVRSAYDQLINQQEYNWKLGDEIEREISELKGDIEAFDFAADHKAYFLNVLDSIDKKSYAYVKWTYGHSYDYLISEFDNTKNAFENFIERLDEYKRSIESATTNSELAAITEQMSIDISNTEAIYQSSWEIDYNSMLQFIDVCKGYEAELLKLLQRLKDLKTELANTTSGIDTIVSTDADMVVYTLIGERLTINANQIKSLPKGIYIINGKKILIQ